MRIPMAVLLCLAPASAAGRIAPLLFIEKTPGATEFFLGAARLGAGFHREGIDFSLDGSQFQLTFAGASRAAVLEGGNVQDATANVLTGRDPAAWKTGLKMYGRLRYRGLYPGIDLTIEPHGEYLKSEFVVAPGARTEAIRLRYSGLESVEVNGAGELVLRAATGEMREHAPEVYSVDAHRRMNVRARYRVFDGGEVGFEIGPHDRRAALVIDPLITFSTYFGGSGADSATAVAVDAAGSAYIAGWTESPDLPSPLGSFGGGVDAFVAKFDRGGAHLAYCTYLGGSGDDRALGLAVDASGAAVITGVTSSPDFPAISAMQAALKGTRDAFIAKLNPSGAGLVFSTYFGGNGSEWGNAVALDSAGNIFIAGATSSSDLPVSGGAQAASGGQQDAFVAALSATGSALLYSTYLGGGNNDAANAIAIDSAGSAYITGSTLSTDFPVFGALQSSSKGQLTAFVTKLDGAGAVLYSTYLGGSGGSMNAPESGQAIAVDSAGNAYIAGATSSADFPAVSAFQPAYGGATDAFIVKLNASGKGPAYSTFLGGHGRDAATGIAVDQYGAAYVTGYTASLDFPVLSAGQAASAGSYDAFLAKLDLGGNLVYSTYLGGSGSDAGSGVAVSAAGNVFVAGQTLSPDFPTAAPLQGANAGNYGAFLTRMADASYGCAYVFTPGAVSAGNGAGSLPLAINTTASCAWSLAPDSLWFRATPSSGVGPATITVSVDSNPFTAARSGNFALGALNVAVNQAAAPCPYALSVSSVHASAPAGFANVSVITAPSCAWGAASDAPWLSITGASGSGNGMVSYSYAANGTGSTRAGTLTIAGLKYNVTQSARRPLAWPPPAAVDFDGDGLSDVAVYHPASGVVYTLLSNGTRSYRAAGNLVGAPYDVVRNGDFNGDLLGDLFFYYRAGGTAKLALSDGTGRFTYAPLSFFPGFDTIVQGDFNGDGRTDLLLYNRGTGMTTMALANGAGGFAQSNNSYAAGATSVAVGDYYGDGRAGALFYGAADGLAYLGRSDSGGNLSFATLSLGAGYDIVAAADLNGDGLCDFILYRSSDGVTYLATSRGDGTFSFAFQYWSPGFTQIKVGDYNGDGKADLILYNAASSIGYQGFGDGRGSFVFQSLFWGPGYEFAQTLDLNGDGTQDVLIYRGADGTSYAGWAAGRGFNYGYAYFGPGRMLAQ